MTAKPAALVASETPPRTKPSNYPEPYASRMAGRVKRPLGDLFGLKNFGVNLTRLAPGAVSTLHHQHSRQDEFVYVLEGQPTLFTGSGETRPPTGHGGGICCKWNCPSFGESKRSRLRDPGDRGPYSGRRGHLPRGRYPGRHGRKRKLAIYAKKRDALLAFRARCSV